MKRYSLFAQTVSAAQSRSHYEDLSMLFRRVIRNEPPPFSR
jgi:hypothetical protein